MEIFTSKKISDRLTRICSPCGVCVYLVEGEKKAALLDTGFGFGNLKAYVESLTKKPLIVLLSHGHMDHAGGAVQFDKVYLNKKDWELEKWHSTRERRIYDVHHGPGGMPKGITDDDFLPSRVEPYLDINEGDVFDLGLVKIKPIAVPGHTRGTLIFLIEEERVAIFGDACGEHTLLLFNESSTIKEYKNGLLHMKSFENKYDTVLRNHGNYESPKQILNDNLELCNDILEGNDAKIDSDFMGQPCKMGRQEKHPGKVGNILYNPNKLY